MVRKWSALLVLTFSLGTLPVTAATAQPSGDSPASAGAQAAAPAATAAAEAPAAPAATGGGDRDAAPEIDRIDGAYLKGYLTDAGAMLTSPLRWGAADWAKVGAVAGITGGLFLADRSIRDFTQRNQSSVASGFASVGNFIGDPLYAPAAVGSFYLYGIFKDDPKARRASLLALESYSLSSLFSSGIKTLAQRHRPETGDTPYTFDGPQWNGKNFSFASGHTSNAFAIATVFAGEYADSRYVPPIAYGLATLTAASRVYSNKHWSSDVFFGAALGYFTGKAILALHKKKDSALTVTPQVSREMLGVSVGYRF